MVGRSVHTPEMKSVFCFLCVMGNTLDCKKSVQIHPQWHLLCSACQVSAEGMLLGWDGALCWWYRASRKAQQWGRGVSACPCLIAGSQFIFSILLLPVHKLRGKRCHSQHGSVVMMFPHNYCNTNSHQCTVVWNKANGAVSWPLVLMVMPMYKNVPNPELWSWLAMTEGWGFFAAGVIWSFPRLPASSLKWIAQISECCGTL